MASNDAPTIDFSNKALFSYWHGRVKLRNTQLIGDPQQINTQTLRHECTNYDELWKSSAVQQLSGIDQDRMVAVIKYSCTSQVLQRRASLLRVQIADIEKSYEGLEGERSKLASVIAKLKRALFGKMQENEALQRQVKALITQERSAKSRGRGQQSLCRAFREF